MEKILEKIKNLTKQQKIIAASIAAVGVVIIAIAAVLIGSALGASNPNVPGDNTQTGGKQTYTIELKSKGGKAFEKIEIHVFEDSSMNDLVSVGKTDANGVFTFEAAPSSDYVAVLKNMPKGYLVENSYTLKEATLSLVLDAKLLSVGDMDLAAPDYKDALRLGDVAADMTVKAADGTTYTISELLKTKEAVVLNFWFEGCDPCKAEFPYIEEAYKEYSDRIELLAINPYDGDDASVAAYKAALGLTFPMTKADAIYSNAYGVTAFPTTVVIDRYGIVGFMHTGSVPSTDSFKALFDYFTGDDYKQSTVRNLDDIVTKVEGGDGTKANPFEEYRTDFDVQVDAGAEVYYQMFKVDGMLFEINDADAYVIFEDKKYEAVDGKVSLILKTEDTYTPAIFVIGNKSAEKKTFAAKLSFVEGTSGNPFVMNLGDFVTKVEAGNEQGIYYTYTATENGTFSLQCTGVTTGAKYDYSLYNTTTFALRNLTSDADGDGTVSIAVNAGDEVQISIGVLPNEDNAIPATEFNFKAAFVKGEGTGVDPNEKVEYSVTVTDVKGKVMSGVMVTIYHDDASEKIKTDASGVARIELPKGNYIVVVSAPNGYKEDPTEYILTNIDNAITISLEQKEVVKKTYTVTVVDENGDAVANAAVTVGKDSFAKTDASGKASFLLEEGDYVLSVVASGYTVTSNNLAFKDGATSIKIEMKKDVVEKKKVEYKVTVVDYKGNAIAGVAVQFKNGGAVVATEEVNANGVASAKLEEGNYTAVVVSESYGSGVVSLTVNSPSASVVAAAKMDASKGVEEYFGMIYPISVGAVYVDLDPNADNYFLFAITEAGKYEIKTTDVNAKLAPCGSSAFVYTPYYESNVYETEAKAGMVGGDIALSVTGTEGAIIIVTRVGDVNETIYREYEGGKAPSKFTLTEDGSKLTYVDVTAGTFDIVLGSDGYYHKGSATGPIVYVNLGTKAPYLSLQTMIQGGGAAGGTPLVSYTKENDSTVRIDYTNFMLAHFENMDKQFGVYPLTEDLKHILQVAGEFNGWWDASNANNAYLFTGVEGLNTQIAWMFACCYVE